SEKLVKEDYYTSIHIEEFEIEARDTKLGPEDITRDIPNVSESALRDLDESGIIRTGATAKQGDILVGNVTPTGETQLTPEQKLQRDVVDFKTGDTLVRKGESASRDTVNRLSRRELLALPVDEETRETVRMFVERAENRVRVLEQKAEERREDLQKGDELPPGVIKMIKVYVAMKRKLSVGDKMAGRHGNKGVISRILPEEDMPYLPDGTPVEIVLNPLGVPS